MNLQKIIIGTLFVSFAFMVMATLWGDSITSYDLNVSIDNPTMNFSRSYDKINDTYKLVSEMKNKTISSELGEGQSIFDTIFKSAFVGLRVIFAPITLTVDAFSLINTILDDLASVIGIPSFIIDFFITALLTIGVFSLIYLVTGRKD